jgi:thiol-disulfide isomerase/thioredoxin
VGTNEYGSPVAFPYFTSQVEGQFVRAAVGMALVTLCLGLTGCSLFGKKSAARSNNNTNNSKPFLGSETPSKADTAAMPSDSSATLANRNGLLAGRVIVASTGDPVKEAYIQVTNLEDEDAKAAKLDVSTNEAGYFTIPGLKVGAHYELSVRAKDNGDVISGKAWAQPPQPTLLIRLDKSNTNARTPKMPEVPNVPDKKGVPASESSQERTPSVSIEAPIRLPDGGASSPGGGTPSSIRDGNSNGSPSPNPANIADGGFRRLTQPSLPATIPSPPPVPGTPTWESTPDQPPSNPSSDPLSSPGSVRLPNVPTPVPSCGLFGNRLNNFALRDLDGKVWEYKVDRRGRLTLLDFWYHTCGPCLHEIPNLIGLQTEYGPYGLEVVSIACETGTLEQQRKDVRTFRNRYGINYVTLLSGGGPANCPVIKSFGVSHYPTLVLLDTDGTIVWHSPETGMDDNAHARLRAMIHHRLVTRQPQP